MEIEQLKPQTLRTARKQHVCNWCCGVINPGEKYYTETNKSEGVVYDFKQHTHCYKLMLFLNIDCYELADTNTDTSDEFSERIRETLYPNYGEKHPIAEKCADKPVSEIAKLLCEYIMDEQDAA